MQHGARLKLSVRRERGATLIVSLILLLILTIVGSSAIDNVSMQVRMTRNAHLEMETYQIALSEIVAQLRQLREDISPLDDALINETTEMEYEELEMTPENFVQNVGVAYAGEGLPPW